MAINETVLDPPVTPAPVFAYRALRGVFFGSPESSPEHVYNNNNNNKENITPVLLSPSPSKRKLVLDGAGSDVLHLTPSTKRTKRDSGGAILSPTKGILRTPGLATPRTKALRDVNVKFKSVSPEEVAQRRTNRLKVESSRQIDVRKEQTQPPVKSEKKIPNGDGVSAPQGTNEGAAVSAFTPCAIEAYIAQTEKEMKKLVKYGQKMREYARKKDAETLELKGMIEVLKRENERLRTSHLGSGQAQSESKRSRQHESDADGRGGHKVESATDEEAYGYVREEVGRVEARSQSVRSHGQSLAHRRKDDASRSHAATGPKPQTTASGASSTKRLQVTDTTLRNNDPRKPSALLREPATTGEGDDHPPLPLPLRSTSGSIAVRDTNTTFDRDVGAGSTRLAPDRLAAARERLRRRAEARKASAEMHAGGHDQSHAAGHGQKEGILIDIDEDDGPTGLRPLASSVRRESREQSLVDWINL
ncbi:hypothetical protein RBB50_009954 [Rhinocladiella similis]